MKKTTIDYEIYFSKRCEHNLNQIEYYIEYELQNQIVANKIIDKLIDKIFILKQFPYIGSIYNTTSRFIVYKNFLIFYEIQEEQKLIIIKTIIHRKRNTK